MLLAIVFYSIGDWKAHSTTERLTDVLTKETQSRLILRLTNRDFRQSPVAIDRRHVRPGKDDDGSGDNHDQMTSYGSHVGDNWYARLKNTTWSITHESLDLFLFLDSRFYLYSVYANPS